MSPTVTVTAITNTRLYSWIISVKPFYTLNGKCYKWFYWIKAAYGKPYTVSFACWTWFLCTWQNLINTSPICITVVLLPTTKHCSVLCLLCSSRLISLPLEALYTRLQILFTPAQSIGLILVWWYFDWPVQTEASCPVRGGTFVTLRTFLGSLYIPPNLPTAHCLYRPEEAPVVCPL